MNRLSQPLQYASVCSGIEAVTVAWKGLGITPAWFAEIDPFACAVLAHHYPEVPNLGDMTLLPRQALAQSIPAPAILIGGTPCQAFSVAGFREGLDDPRGALSLNFMELADAIDQVRIGRHEPEAIIVWENVPGVLTDKGNAFGCFLAALAGEEGALLPPGKAWSHAGVVFGPQRTIAWRLLDAQYFGLAQRRRRVFLIASARTGFDPAAVLFESESLRRDTAPHRSPQTNATCVAETGTPAGSGIDTPIPFPNTYCMASGQASAEAALELCPTLTCNHDVAIVVCSTQDDLPCGSTMSAKTCVPETSLGPSIRRKTRHRARRLLPVECERLQGLPDGYTRIPRRHYPTRRISRSRPSDLWEPTESGWMLMAADGPRHRAIGNTMAVPCLIWIGRRLLSALSKYGAEHEGIDR